MNVARILVLAREGMLTQTSGSPGNLIIGGGGRGVRRAPKALGIGEWEVLKAEDDPIGKVYVRKGPSLEKGIDKAVHHKA